MVVYWGMLILILINGLVNYKNRKWFVFSSFFIIVLVAALRSENVGTDLTAHYAQNFEIIAKASWSQVLSGSITGYNVFLNGSLAGGYDTGWMVYCKLLSLVSSNQQWFIIATSIFIYFSVALYIYRYAEDIVLETVAFICSLIMFNYLNILAQATAHAIILLALPWLFDKKYIRFAGVILFASTIHQTALFCLIFIPLSFLKAKRKYVLIYSAAMLIAVASINPILNFMVNTIFTSFTHYLGNSRYGVGHVFSGAYLVQLMIYVSSLVVAFIFLFVQQGDYDEIQSREIKSIGFARKNEYVSVQQPSNNFLIFMTITSVACCLMVSRVFVVWRMGCYIFLFGFTLMSRALNNIYDYQQKLVIKLLVYALFLLVFTYFAPREGVTAYGVLPYEFFWN